MPIYINKNGQQSGPYEDHIVIDRLRSGELSPGDLGIHHGDATWQRLGDMFPGFGPQSAREYETAPEPSPAGGGVSPAPSAKKGGCLKFGLIGAGLLLLFLGIATAAGSRFIPSTSCDLADYDAKRIDKLRTDLEKARSDGKFERIGPLQIELTEATAGAEVSQKYCNDDKFRNNLIAAAGGVVGLLGLLMAVVGIFVGRRK